MTNKHWRKKQGKDQYFRKAKAEGYRARSAYKLTEINSKFRVIRKHDRVLDIGAAPGSWSQLAHKLVGPRGHVVGVDIKEIEPLPGITFIQGDIREASVLQQLQAAVNGESFNTVISDIAPNASGVRIRDHVRSIELSLFALTVALQVLRKGGNFATKTFMGEDFGDLLKLTKRYFRRVNVFEPESSRKESRETFIVAKNLQSNALLDANMGLEALLGG